MNDNNTDREFFKKLSKFDILLGVCCIFMVGYTMIVDALHISEGNIAILSNIISSFSFYLIIFVVFRYMKIDLEKNQNIKREIKSKNQLKMSFASAVFFIALFFMILTAVMSVFLVRAYYSVFESSQTMVTDEYETDFYERKGEYYKISFRDIQNPEKCVEEYGNICVTQRTFNINKTTYEQLKDLEPKNNPIRITFKDKAEVVMNIEFSQNGL